MDESAKAAYRHLGLTGYASIRSLSSGLKVGTLNLGTTSHINARLRAIDALAEWFSLLMEANVADFAGFDEQAFWKHHKHVCSSHPGHDFDVYRELFEDSISHVRANS